MEFKILMIAITFSITLFGQLKNPKNIPFKWITDTMKTEIDLSEISVVLPRGSFQVLNYPEFINMEQGLNSYLSNEPVICIDINGKAKAFPLNILSVHEIVNDTISGIPFLATFCPLCNSGVVYDRRYNDKILDFEVSGMLRNSDMVMADKQTETWWQQLMGRAIVGELAGAELKIIQSLVISVEDYFTRYPDGLILSKSSGGEAQKYYGQNFYEKYDSEDGKPYSRYFDHNNLDNRLAPMERIVDIRSQGEFKIYRFKTAAKEGVINDEFNGKNIVVFYKPGIVSILDKKDISESKDIGSVTVFNSNINSEFLKFSIEGNHFLDDKTSSRWDITGKCLEGELEGHNLEIEPHGNHFAFAWLAFHPHSIIYEN